MAKNNEIAKAESASLQPLENIENLIHVIRGKQVMLDRDLARLYGVETKRLNQQVQRNLERFPGDFMFQLNKEEFENWKSQFATSNPDIMHVCVGVDDGSRQQYIQFPVSLSYMGISWDGEFETEFSKDLQRDMNKFYAANNRIPTANEYKGLTEMHLYA